MTFTVDAAPDAPLATLDAWLVESYRAVAPKRLAATLDAGQRGAGA